MSGLTYTSYTSSLPQYTSNISTLYQNYITFLHLCTFKPLKN